MPDDTPSLTQNPPGVRLRVLGGVDLRDATGKEVRAVLAQPKRLALLAYLALTGPDRYVRRDTLLALFWPEADQDAARHALRTSLHFLRQSLGEGVVNGRGQEELGLGDAGLWCDALEFERSLREGRFAEALALYRGDLLEGFFVAEASADFEGWLDTERQRLRQLAADAAVGLAEAAERNANAALARHWAARCLALAPHDEGALRRLMALLLRIGDRAGALQLYEGFAARVARDLDIKPSAETRALADRIREPEPVRRHAATPPSVPAGPPPASEQSGGPRRKPAMRWAVVAAVGLGILVTAILFQTQSPPNPPILAVGTIEVRLSTPADSAESAGALRDLLATDLARVPGLQVVSEARLLELLAQLGVRQEDRAARTDAARRAGAGELLEGVLYRRSPDRLRLDLNRMDLATGVLHGGLSAEAADLFALADSAAIALGRAYGLRAPPSAPARATPASLVARRFYEEGLRAYYQVDPYLALRLFRSALAEDPGLAMAAYYAAQMASWIEPAAAAGFMVQARRAAAGLPERDRLLIATGWAQFANDPSLRVFAESLATRHATEPDGEYALGRALAWSGDWAGAIVHLRRAVAMDSLGLEGRVLRCRACEALETIVEAQTTLGEARAAEATVRDWVARQPESAMAWQVLTNFLERSGRAKEALESHRRVVALTPSAAAGSVWLRIRLAIRSAEFEEADQLLASQLDLPGVREADVLWWVVISLRNQNRFPEALAAARRYQRAMEAAGEGTTRLPEAQVLFESGRFRESALRFEELATDALRLMPSDSAVGSFGAPARRGSWGLTHAAVAWAAAGDAARLATLADSVERLGARSAFGRDQRLHFHLRGLLAKSRGRLEEAEAMFRRAQIAPVASYSRVNLELGRLLLERGRPPEAAEVLRAGLLGDLEASNYYVTHRELHAELARAFRAAGMGDSAAAHERWGR